MKAHTSLLSTVLALTTLVLSAPACVGVEGDADDDDGDDGPSSEVCINEACEEEEEEAPEDNGACPAIAELKVNPSHTGGPDMCSGYAPGECDLLQDECSVQIACSDLGTQTVTIDEDGVSEDFPWSIGDGIVATCHVELDEPGFWIILVCSAQGITCEFTDSTN